MMMTINALGGRLVFGTLFLYYIYFYSMVLVPPDDDVEVRNIEVNFTLHGYHFKYELTGYKKHAIMIKGKVV